MFGVDFSELMVILVVALIVIGPERLPKVARTLGLLWGRAQRFINGVKADIERDIAMDEFRRLQQQVKQEVSSAELAVSQFSQTIDHEVKQINDAIEHPPQSAELATSTISPQLATPQKDNVDLPPSFEQKQLPLN
jgi:sec-independent protein translocase protein TatB